MAGNGFAGFLDGPVGHYNAAEIGYPAAVAVDLQGNVLVSVDFAGIVFLNSILKIDPSGVVSTFVGGSYGFVDGTIGPTGTAQVNEPLGMVVDAEGNIYFVDSGNNAIRKIDPQGNLTTLAGNGMTGYVDGTGGINGTAEFNNPQGGLAVDGSGNVYVADSFNNVIRKIDPQGNVTTFAGNGTAGFVDGTGGLSGTAEFNGPIGMALDAQGNLIVADLGNNSIRKVDPQGNVTTLAGNGATGYVDGTGGMTGTAEFNFPLDVRVDSQGMIWVADETNSVIRLIDAQGNVTTAAGNGVSGWVDGTGGHTGTAEFNGPSGLAIDAQGNVIVADANNNRIRSIDANHNVTTFAGNGSGGFLLGDARPDGTAQLWSPFGVVVDAAGNLFVADSANNRIRKVSTDGTVSTVAGNGTPGFVDGAAGNAEFNFPAGIAIDAQGNLFVADSRNNRIRKIDTGGNVSTIAGNGNTGFVDGPGGPLGIAEFSRPFTLVVDASGNIFVADYGNNSIREIDSGGIVSTFAGNGHQGSTDGTGGRLGTAEFAGPSGLVLDGQGNIFVADTYSFRVRKIDSSGNVTTFTGNGTFGYVDGTGGRSGTAEFSEMVGIVMDAQGNLYVADGNNNNRIREIDPSGNVTTIAGNGNSSFRNDFGTASSFNLPEGMAIDAQGNLYVADSHNNCIRKLTP